MNYYQLLGVTASSSIDEINVARRALAMQWHPDRAAQYPGNAGVELGAKMAEVNAAHSVLTDRAATKKYRAELRSDFPKVCSACHENGQTYKQKGSGRVYQLCMACSGVGLVR